MHSTSLNNSKQLVLQIVPEAQADLMQINGKVAPLTFAHVFIPKLSSNYLQCPLNYFQENASLSGKWIKDSLKKLVKQK